MQRHILKRGEPGLIETSEPVEDIENARRVVSDLWDTLRSVQAIYDFPGSNGLSAPQIGELIRVAIIKDGERSWTLINPEIIERSDQEFKSREGCLSFFDYRGITVRSESIAVKATDENGNTFSIEAEGKLAVLFQHEIDHLDGVLFDQRLAPGEQLNKVEGMPDIP